MTSGWGTQLNALRVIVDDPLPLRQFAIAQSPIEIQGRVAGLPDNGFGIIGYGRVKLAQLLVAQRPLGKAERRVGLQFDVLSKICDGRLETVELIIRQPAVEIHRRVVGAQAGHLGVALHRRTVVFGVKLLVGQLEERLRPIVELLGCAPLGQLPTGTAERVWKQWRA